MTRSMRAAVALPSMLVLALGAGATNVLAIEAIGVLNDTGQTSCYGAVDYAAPYNTVPCDEATTGDESPFPYQDGRYGRDAAAAMGRLPKIGGGEASFDFTRVCMSGEDEGHGACASPPPLPTDLEHPEPNDWACLRDNVTGLTYTLGNLEPVTWAEASSTEDGSYIQRANDSSRCGFGSGWRLPARREGFSLLNAQRMFPNAVDGAYFPILGNNPPTHPARPIWSSDPTAWHAMFQWVIAFDGFYAASMQCRELAPPAPCDEYPGGVTAWTAGVLLVNGAWRQPPPPDGRLVKAGERWQIRDDGLIVTDTATELMWDRCGWGQTGPDCESDIAIFPNWQDAMQVAVLANTQRYKGYHDWRVPNARELESLIKIDANPAFDAAVFPNTLHTDDYSYYWTSSQAEYLAGFSPAAYVVGFAQGVVGTTDKVYMFNPGEYPYIAAVRLVRGGMQWDAFDDVSDHLFWDDFDGSATPGAMAH